MSDSIKVEYRFKAEKLMQDIREACPRDATLREIGARVGVSASTLSRFDNGTMLDFPSFLLVCGALDLTPGDYFERITWERRS